MKKQIQIRNYEHTTHFSKSELSQHFSKSELSQSKSHCQVSVQSQVTFSSLVKLKYEYKCHKYK